MDNFLTLLYFEKFRITEREKGLNFNNTWENNEAGRLNNVRNDQSISEVRQQGQMLNKFIKEYINKLKSE